MPSSLSQDQDGSVQPVSSPPSVLSSDSSMRKLGVGARASSPAKRSASERDEEDGALNQNTEMHVRDQSRSPKKIYQEHVSPMPNRFKPANEFQPLQRSMSSDMLDQDDTTEHSRSVSGPVVPGGSLVGVEMYTSSVPLVSGAADTNASQKRAGSSIKIPSFDEQDRMIRQLASKPLGDEGGKGYVLSSKWLVRVQARTTQGLHESHAKDAREGEVGPVDNSDIAMNGKCWMMPK